jgi:serine/threonine protein kinase/Tfp pilus assembly protein PilF
MNSDRFDKVRELVLKVSALPEGERQAFLDDVCRDDPELRQEVESLLVHEGSHPESLKTGGALLSDPIPVIELPNMSGRTLSHFRIEEKIATGGMGVLYRASDLDLRRPVALKVLRPDVLSHEGSRERFVREARAASALNHPCIVTIYEIGEDDGVDFIAMEYVEGPTLDEIIPPDGMAFNTATRYALAISEALDTAHEKGIVHRDLKPSNIKVTGDDKVKILDFGIAKVLRGVDDLPPTQITQTGFALGTLSYMSPEQVEGRKVDQRSDIFSLGTLMYEMITGRTPFHRKNMAATLHAIVHDEPELLSRYREEVPAALQAIIDHALEKEKDDRYPTSDELAEDIRRFQSTRELIHASPADEGAKHPKVKSLAVLYLKNLGSEEDEYLSYGITEDLIIDLTRIGTLRVAPMRLIMKQRELDDELEEIARKLDVRLVLDGSIRRSQSSVRVSAQLVDVVTGKNLWADRWEEPAERLPQIKKSLADAISRVLEVDSTAVKSAQVGLPEAQDPRAYEFYLRGKYTFERKKDMKDVEVALGLYHRALSIEPSLMAARAGVSRIFIHKAEYDQANQALTSALAEARDQGMRADEATVLQLLANLYTAQSQWDEAWEYGNKALEIRRELGDLSGEAEVLGDLIDILRGRAKFTDALKLSERILEINQQLNDQEKAAHAIVMMGTVYWRMGNYDRALELYEEAEEIAHKRDDTLLEAHCVMNVGVILSELGQLDEALERFEKALFIFTQLGEKEHRASLLNNIALIRMAHSEYRNALELYEQAATIADELGNRANYALYQVNLAIILTITGDYSRAIQVANEALTIATKLDYPLVVAFAYLSMGIAHFYRGEDEKASDYFHSALEVTEPAGHRREVAVIHAFLGELFYMYQDPDSCKEHSEKALILAEEVGEKTTLLKAPAYLAALMSAEGLFEDGVRRLREVSMKANEYGDPLYILIVRRLLGQVLLECGQSQSDREEGHSILEEALALAREKEVAYEIDWIREILK